MNKDSIKDIPNIPGVYCVINTINNKHYIGQSINLHKRLMKHMNRYNDNDSLLYEQIREFGIDNFSVKILDSFDTKDFTYIKPILDRLEKEYIIKYNSMYPNGYNKTTGGESGGLGYKFTEEQKKIVSHNTKRFIDRFYKPAYLKSIITGYTKMYISETHAAKDMKCSRSTIARLCDHRLKLFHNEWVGGRNYNDFIIPEHTNNVSVDEYYKILKSIQKDDFLPKQSNICKKLNICRKTVCTYNNKLREKGLIKTIGYHKNILL